MSKPPLRLGPYVLIERIGKGGMAEVWRGQWIGPDGGVMPCALKRMLPEVALNEDAARMFVDERRMSMRLNHANVCRVLPAAGSETYIAMEWVNGMNLADLTSRLRLGGDLLSFETIRYIVHCLLRALEHAHMLRVGGVPYPIIHRDVSPQNVMISVHGEVKLMDFGVARVLADETSPAEFAGKLRYCPREQVMMGKMGPATDLYAVGAVLHEMVEGSLFRADCSTKAQMIETIKQGHIPVLTRPGVPDWCRALHKALLQPNSDERPASAREALTTLGRVTAEQDELGQMVSFYLGAQAGMSGSTTAHHAAVPVEPSSTPAVAPEISPRPASAPSQDADQVRDGELLQRTPTAVVSKRHAARQDPPIASSLDTDGAVPRPRPRPRAEWFRLVEPDDASKQALPHPTPSEPHQGQGAAEEREPCIETDAPVAPTQEETSDDLAVTEVRPVGPPDGRGVRWLTTAAHVGTVVAPVTPPKAKAAGWRLAGVLLVALVGMVGAGVFHWAFRFGIDDAAPASLLLTAPRGAEVELSVDADTWIPISAPLGNTAKSQDYHVRWRPDADASWRDGGTQSIESGGHYIFEVTDEGLSVHADETQPEGNR